MTPNTHVSPAPRSRRLLGETRRCPGCVAVIRHLPVDPMPPLRPALPLLPEPVCLLGEILAREAFVEVDGPAIYVVSDRSGRVMYIGRTDDDIREHFRRHLTPRRDGSTSAFDRALAREDWYDWEFAVAPPDWYAPFIARAVALLRQRLGGRIRPRLAARLDVLLAQPERWATARGAAWAAIATIAPAFNVRGNSYGTAHGTAARPLALLERFATIAEQEARREDGRGPA